MQRIYQSATRIVLLIMTLAICAALFVGKISQESFTTIATLTFSYYFTRKKDDSTNNT